MYTSAVEPPEQTIVLPTDQQLQPTTLVHKVTMDPNLEEELLADMDE